MMYYELIGKHTGKVIGVCSSDGLFPACERNDFPIVGPIYKEQFDAYGKSPWTEPASKSRYSTEKVEAISLTPLSK